MINYLRNNRKLETPPKELPPCEYYQPQLLTGGQNVREHFEEVRKAFAAGGKIQSAENTIEEAEAEAEGKGKGKGKVTEPTIVHTAEKPSTATTINEADFYTSKSKSKARERVLDKEDIAKQIDLGKDYDWTTAELEVNYPAGSHSESVVASGSGTRGLSQNAQGMSAHQADIAKQIELAKDFDWSTADLKVDYPADRHSESVVASGSGTRNTIHDDRATNVEIPFELAESHDAEFSDDDDSMDDAPEAFSDGEMED